MQVDSLPYLNNPHSHLAAGLHIGVVTRVVGHQVTSKGGERYIAEDGIVTTSPTCQREVV